MAVEPLQTGRYSLVVVGRRAQPGGRPLEHIEVLDDRLDPRDDLDGRRPGPDHGHPAPGQIVVVVPASGVERRALEVRETWKVRRRGLAQEAGCRDQQLDGERTAGCLDAPDPRGVVPLGGCDLAPDVDVIRDSEAVGHRA